MSDTSLTNRGDKECTAIQQIVGKNMHNDVSQRHKNMQNPQVYPQQKLCAASGCCCPVVLLTALQPQALSSGLQQQDSVHHKAEHRAIPEREATLEEVGQGTDGGGGACSCSFCLAE